MEDFLIYLLKSCGLLGTFYMFYIFLLKKETSFVTNRKFLLAGLITSAVLPAIYYTRTVLIEASTAEFTYTEGDYIITEEVLQASTWSPLKILCAIYILGVCIMLGRLLLQSFSLARILCSGTTFTEGNCKYIETRREIAPFSFLNYIVYNPALHRDNELQHILKHEKAHVSQWHTADVLLANFNLAYQWFNPFAWLYIKNLQQNLEFIADREAVKNISCKKEYQKALVKISVENFNLALTNNFYQSLIKQRIMMLNKNNNNRTNSWKAAFILPALLAFIFLFNIKTVAQIKEQDPEVSTATSSNLEISFNITPNSNREQLESYSRLMQKYDVQLDFKDLEYNDAGLLTSISVNFLDKNNNSSGSMSRNNTEGIKPFTFYFSEEAGAGFRSEIATKASTGFDQIENLGKAPLYIIDGEEYPASQLVGKTIKVKGGVTSLNSSQAVEKYGNAAKDGVIIITEGTIIEDFQEELKRIDATEAGAVNNYLQIKKGTGPSWVNLNKKAKNNISVGTGSTQSQKDSTRVLRIKNINTGGKEPLYILNGEVVKNPDTIHLLNPNNIGSINVLKGASATSLYGKKAKDGAILIVTKANADTTAAVGATSGRSKPLTISTRPGATGAGNISITTKQSDSIRGDSINIIRREYNNVYTITTDGVEINAYQNGTRTSPSNTVFIPQEKNKPLYVVDGKVKEKEYDLNEIEPTNIESIHVLKSEGAIEKYGEKGKNGVIEIILKEKGK